MSAVLERLRRKPKQPPAAPQSPSNSFLDYNHNHDINWQSPQAVSPQPQDPYLQAFTNASSSTLTSIQRAPGYHAQMPPPTAPSTLNSPEGWHILWIPRHSNWAFEKNGTSQVDGTSIATWVAQSPLPSNDTFTGQRIKPMELLQILLTRQPNNIPQPLVDPNLIEKEGVEWNISYYHRSIYNSIYHAWSDTFHIEVFSKCISLQGARMVYDLVKKRDGYGYEYTLSESEFAVGMHLIYRKLNDYSLPSVLPPQLVFELSLPTMSPGATAVVEPKPAAEKAPSPPTLPEDGDWSGRGQHVEYSRGESIPLTVGDHLGRGASADVHKVTTSGGVVLARKLIYCARAVKLDDVKRELEILRKVNHKHIIKLVGSYSQGRQLGLLLLPAAVCDLGTFLDEVDEQQRSGEKVINEQLGAILEKLGAIPVRIKDADPKSLDFESWEHMALTTHRRLRSYYGCLASGLEYLHQNDIRHKDIKTRNVLLDKSRGLYITDFGISRDNTDVSTSVTNGIERGTYKYCAPEVATYEPRGRAADIYSLGCVFLEMETVYRGVSLLEFDKLRKENDVDSSFQANPERLTEWMEKLRLIPNEECPDLGVFHLVDLIQKMLSVNPETRPKIDVIRRTLATLGNMTCKCDGESGSDFGILLSKYNKVKRLYFESRAEVEVMRSIFGRLWESKIINPELKAQVPDVQKDFKQALLNILDLPEATISTSLSSPAKSNEEYLTASELKQENEKLKRQLFRLGDPNEVLQKRMSLVMLNELYSARKRATPTGTQHDAAEVNIIDLVEAT